MDREGPWGINGQQFWLGEIVGIREGPFTDFVGELKGVDIDKKEIAVLLSIFGRPHFNYVSYNGIEKITRDRYIVRLRWEYATLLDFPWGAE